MAETRCAIYTRKSSEEGLEQDFNSLDAQREACAAFIASQRHEGWVALKEAYEDGGFSGGNTNRPALLRLMEDIKARKVDIIVVYKIDRLTRSLADFAKMVEVFDSHKVSFVSVTQQFNTTTSMGRLTLNVLLSFAQFEREVTSERIRDKIAASKAKGMWMGGTVPLGYRVENRQLHPHPTEASLVQHIFATYLRLGSVQQLRDALHAEGHKPRASQNFFTGALANLLRNPIYIGKIPHGDKVHQGTHPALIDEDTWQQVQALRAAGIKAHTHRIRAKEPSLLMGKLFDAAGHPMSPVHANKQGRRYRYYVSQGVIQGRALAPDAITRIPARELENLVQRFLQQMLGNDGMVSSLLPNISHLLRAEAQRLNGVWDTLNPTTRHELTRAMIAKVCLKNGAVEMIVSPGGLEAVLAKKEVVSDPAEIGFSHLIPINLQPVQKGGTLILTDGPLAVEREATPELVRALAQGTMANRWLARGECRTQQEAAQRLNIHERQLRRILPLALLAPEIVQQVMRGATPAGLTIGQLIDVAQQSDWAAQRRALNAL